MNDNGMLVLPAPISLRTLKLGGEERITIGKSTVRFGIPPGVRLFSRIRLAGQAKLIDPKLVGDLYLLIIPEDSPIYRVQRDIELEMQLPREKLELGSVERLEVGRRRLDVRIPRGFRSGKQLRLGGLAHLCNGGYPGDVLLRVSALDCPKSRWFGVFDKFGPVSKKTFTIEFNIVILRFAGAWEIDSRGASLDISDRR